MHVHLPKPLHGWREFVGEVGIIVLGVLIALTAEQAVEHVRAREKVRAAEQTMNQEIRNSLLAAVELDRLKECSAKQLDALQAAIVAGDDAKARLLLKGQSVGTLRQWADNAFEATLTAQVGDQIGSETLGRYSQVYQMIRLLRKDQDANEYYVSDLAVLYTVPDLPSTPEHRYAQLREIANYRVRLGGMYNTGNSLLRAAKQQLSLSVSDADFAARPNSLATVNDCKAAAAAIDRDAAPHA